MNETLSNCSAKIDGNGNTIRLKAPLFETFSGEINDLNFMLEKEYKGGGVIGKNEGSIYEVAIATDEILIVDKTGTRKVKERDGQLQI
jgi:hypothetical protein